MNNVATTFHKPLGPVIPPSPLVAAGFPEGSAQAVCAGPTHLWERGRNELGPALPNHRRGGLWYVASSLACSACFGCQ